MYDIEFYVTPEGRNLYRAWMQQLRDQTMRVAADRRIARVRSGNFGDHKYCQDGIWELRIALGPGLRIYYGLQGEGTAIVICAGDKSTQSADIRRAAAIWKQISFKQRRKPVSPTIPYDKAMVETYREEPAYALTMIESLLHDGEPHEVSTILGQMISAFGIPELTSGCELPANLASESNRSSPTLDGLKKTLRLMRAQITDALNGSGAFNQPVHKPSGDSVHP